MYTVMPNLLLGYPQIGESIYYRATRHTKIIRHQIGLDVNLELERESNTKSWTNNPKII